MKTTMNHTCSPFRQSFSAMLFFCMVVVFAHHGCRGMIKISALNDGSAANFKTSIIRINVTQQGYNFHRPWQQLPPKTQTAIGVLIDGPLVLVTASFLANHRYIELEKIDSGEKNRAVLRHVDYEADLALIQAEDASFLKNIRPLKLTREVAQGNALEVWQVKSNGTVVSGKATLTAAEIVRYSYHASFLVYRLHGSLQFISGNITMPVVKNGHLVGLVKHYNPKNQTIDVIPEPVIQHFMTDAMNGKYLGFPKPGIRVVDAEDPQLRRYLGIPEHIGGVYVENVPEHSAAGKAGIREGDIIFRIGEYDVDRRGNYRHPLFDRIGIHHLMRCGFYVGDPITYHIYRSGQFLSFEVLAEHQPTASRPVPPHIIDSPPRYYILGGLVFVELTMSYLLEYGKDWLVKAPIYLVYYEKNQDLLDLKERKRIVLLTGVLPTSQTIGYESLADLVVARINDQPVTDLDDIPETLQNSINGFHKIEFEQRPKYIYLDPADLPTIDQQITRRYHLPALYNLDR